MDSEGGVEGDAEAGTVGAGGVAVRKTPYVVDAEAAKEVVDAGADFHVGAAVHPCGCGTFGELQQ